MTEEQKQQRADNISIVSLQGMAQTVAESAFDLYSVLSRMSDSKRRAAFADPVFAANIEVIRAYVPALSQLSKTRI